MYYYVLDPFMVIKSDLLKKELSFPRVKIFFYLYAEEYGQYYGQMNTMQAGRMMTVKRDGLPYEEMGYCPPPNRKLPPVPGQHSNYNTIDRLKNGKQTVLSLFYQCCITEAKF